MWVDGQCHTLATLSLRKRPGTHCVGGWVNPRAGLDRCGKSRPPPGFDPRTVQPVASRYTDCVISDHLMHYTLCYLEITRQAVRNIMGERNLLHYKWQHSTLPETNTPLALSVFYEFLCSISCVCVVLCGLKPCDGQIPRLRSPAKKSQRPGKWMTLNHTGLQHISFVLTDRQTDRQKCVHTIFIKNTSGISENKSKKSGRLVMSKLTGKQGVTFISVCSALNLTGIDSKFLFSVIVY
jgi:hypothetical protein